MSISKLSDFEVGTQVRQKVFKTTCLGIGKVLAIKPLQTFPIFAVWNESLNELEDSETDASWFKPEDLEILK